MKSVDPVFLKSSGSCVPPKKPEKTENATNPENKTTKLLYRKIKYRSHLKEKTGGKKGRRWRIVQGKWDEKEVEKSRAIFYWKENPAATN